MKTVSRWDRTRESTKIMRGGRQIQAVIWDLGGVILRTQDWSARRRWESRLGLAKNELEGLVFNGEMGRKAAIGKASSEDVWAWVAGRLALPESRALELESDFWLGDHLDQALIDFIRSLRSTYKIGLITNAWPEIRNQLEAEWEIDDLFDVIVVSAEEGIVKPDPHLYQVALSRLEVQPEEAVFIDDFIENVVGAREVGMHAIHFQDPEQTRAELHAYLEKGS